MRIISGKFRGKQIVSSKDQSIRPTTNKIKEYIFQILGDTVQDANVLDLFSGSGNLGLESISRGAENATFVDISQSSIRVLRKNINTLSLDETVRVLRRDAVKFLKTNAQPYDLIFIDPPHQWNAFDKMMPLLFIESNLKKFGLVILESEIDYKVEWESETWEMNRQKKFDRSYISFFNRKTDV